MGHRSVSVAGCLSFEFSPETPSLFHVEMSKVTSLYSYSPAKGRRKRIPRRRKDNKVGIRKAPFTVVRELYLFATAQRTAYDAMDLLLDTFSINRRNRLAM